MNNLFGQKTVDMILDISPNDMVDHLKMPDFLLKGNDFSQMRQGIMARFG